MSSETAPSQPTAETSRATLIVMVGLPATGKTTAARRIEVERRALRSTPDEWMIPLFNEPESDGKRDVLEGRFVWLAQRALRAGMDVILDFGVWTRDERSALRFLAADVGASCELRYVKAEHEEQLERITQRALVEPDCTFVTTEGELLHFRELFQEPDTIELNSTKIDPPPPGYSTWQAWISNRWPTSMH